MALYLVDYGASDDDSDQEMDETPGTQAAVIFPPKSVVVNKLVPSTSRINNEDVDIPKPSEKELKLAELARREKANLSKSDLLSHVSQKKGGKIVIGIPSLTELEDDADEKKVKKASFTASKGQSKLFTKLPPPKNAGYEPPTEVKSTIPKKSNPLIPHAVAKKQKALKSGSDDEDNDDSGSFFTMDEPALKIVAEPEPIVFQQQPAQVASTYYDTIPTNEQYNMANLPESYIQPSQEEQMELDDIALQALQGSSGTKRKFMEEAPMIEIKGERLTYDPSNSQLKSISLEQGESRGPDIAYSKVHKKKHQITYLAAQAKAREVELKNQWAANKSTKRQTQAKYGF